MHAYSKKPKLWFSGLLMFTMLTACGQDTTNYRSQSRQVGQEQSAQKPAAKPIATSSSPAVEAKKDTLATAATPSIATPAADPAKAPVKLAIRTVPNAAELSAMKALYALPSAQGGCADCHGALAASEKKGRTAAALAAASTRTNHRTPVAAKVWPTDVTDTKDDGIDDAKLNASALAELLK